MVQEKNAIKQSILEFVKKEKLLVYGCAVYRSFKRMHARHLKDLSTVFYLMMKTDFL